MTKIQWTDKAWNPVRGCSRVSAGCENCYAMGQAHRFAGPGKPYEGLTTIRRGKVDWQGSARFVPEMLSAPLRWKKPRRVFVNSMSDLFHESLSFEEIAAVFGVMAACPQHTFQVLTKRPRRALEFFEWLGGNFSGALHSSLCLAMKHQGDWDPTDEHCEDLLDSCSEWPLPNVHLGVSAENQDVLNERAWLLLKVPAAVRFLSLEPLLGPIDLNQGELICKTWRRGATIGRYLDWVIAGGESGHGARPCNVEWIRSIVRQCKEARVPCFVKQLGAKPRAIAIDMPVPYEADYPQKSKKGDDPDDWPEDLRVREFPESGEENG